MTCLSSYDFFVQWHLTERCNLRCTHCYQSEEKSPELSFAEIEEVLDEITEMMDAWQDKYALNLSRSLSLTGGEPFLRQDFHAILDACLQAGFDIYILSNGTLIDKEVAKSLALRGVKGVQVSMEGPEHIHDSVRGRGSFRASVRGVRHLLESGIVVTLNTTLSALNADSFPDMIDLASSLGVQKLGFSRLVPSGRGAGLLDKMLDAGKVKELYEKIFSLPAGPLKIVSGDPLVSHMNCNDYNDTGNIMTGGCAAGLSGFTLLADGTITPCRRLPVSLGNVKRDSLREVWAASPVLEQLRDRGSYKGKCGGCAKWASCRGCRAIAYAYAQAKGSTNFLADDPQCFIRP